MGETGNGFVHYPLMTIQEFIGLLGFISICLVTGAAAGWFTVAGVGAWYDHLRKPAFNPPKWIFGPVWTALYLLMAVAAFLVWREVGLWHIAMGLFFFQLLLNFAWSFIFFSAHKIGFALADIVMLWLAIIATMVAFAEVSSAAAWLFAPYLAWVSFASLLNASILRLNSKKMRQKPKAMAHHGKS